MIKYFLLLSFIFLFCHSAGAFCFEEAGKEYNISPQLLWAIAQTESNFKIEATNQNKNGTFDYGVMQINSSWYRKLGAERWSKLSDPCYNVRVGAWILSQCVKKHGYTWEAVGCYNSPNKEKGSIYANKVYERVLKLTSYRKSTGRVKRTAQPMRMSHEKTGISVDSSQ